MLRRAGKPVAAAVVLIGAPLGYYYYRSPEPLSFELPIRVRDSEGKAVMSSKTVTLQDMDTVNFRIREHAVHESKARPNGITWNHTTAALASNDPLEDANSNDIVQKRDGIPGDLLFFAVMDGHGGHHTSQVLSKVLINAVALELANLVDPPKNASKSSMFGTVKSWVSSSSSAPDADPALVSFAIQEAYTKLDTALLSAPLMLLQQEWKENERDKLPDLSQHDSALTLMQRAVSGSCALMAVIDTAHRDLYIACTGDARAVAGVWEEIAGGGQWRVEVLSEDQTGRNPSEKARIQSEHPASESEDVIRNGRVLGGLEPTRAFGDARYKWPRSTQEVLSHVFMAGNNKPMRSAPSLFKTPPYVTALPVVTHRKLSFLPPPTPDSAPSDPKSAMRFLVLATDGLWDALSSEQVVALVGGHLAGLKGTVSKADLDKMVPITTGTPTVDGKAGKNTRKKEQEAVEGSWAFEDENVSAHLIRNAFGGGDTLALRKLLSIPPPTSRNYRDDVTVTVVWWEEGKGGTPKVETITRSKL